MITSCFAAAAGLRARRWPPSDSQGVRLPHPGARALQGSLFGSAVMPGAGPSGLESAIAQSQLAAHTGELVEVCWLKGLGF